MKNHIISKSSALALRAGLSIAISTSAMANTALPNDDWLHVEGNQILDMQGNPVWLTGVNWFGFNASERVFHGLWSVNLDVTMRAMADRGINLIRVPISTELLKEWKNGIYKPGNINTYANPELEGKHSLDVFDAMLASAKKNGVKILLDVHSAEADNSGHYAKLWYKGDITSEDFYSTWEWVADRYKNDDTIIAFDLENEPHGQPWAGEFAKWDNSSDENNWKYACETAANRILDVNPNMLIMCEGIESFPQDSVTWTSPDKFDYHNTWWGGNLRGVAQYPVDLGARQSQLMYSPHDYGPLVFKQPWFYEGFNKETLYQDVWKDNWLFIHEQGIAPLLIGEWGGFMDAGDNEKWMIAIRDLIIENRLHHTFWCLNPNSGDTGGLLLHDWTTWDEEKYALFEPSLWKDSQGKYVGLDHQVILGSSATGTNVGEYYAGPAVAAVTLTSPAANTEFAPGADAIIHYNLTGSSGVRAYINDMAHTTTASNSQVIIQAPMQENTTFTVKLVALNAQNTETNAVDSVVLRTGMVVVNQPSIVITQPLSDQSINALTTFTVTVNKQFAAKTIISWNGTDTIIAGTTTTLTAPATAGNYTLTATAADDTGTPLSASSSIMINVIEPSYATLSCSFPAPNVWSGGFVINNITVTNTGVTTVDQWQAITTFDKTVTLANGWSAKLTATANQVIATPVNYNAQLAPGASATFGFQGSFSGNAITATCLAK